LAEDLALSDGVAQALQDGLTCRAGQERLVQLVTDDSGLADERVLLAIEVVEEGAWGDADRVGDVIDGDVVEAVFLDEGQGRVLEGTPGVLLLLFPASDRRGNISRCLGHICSLCIIAEAAKLVAV